MNTRRLSRTVALLGLSTLLGASAAKACKYCYAAEQAAANDYAQQAAMTPGQVDTQSGAFPLDNTISQFKPTTAPAALATPPPAGSVVTSAADLQMAARLPAASPAPAPVQVVAAPVPKSKHYADAGLLGLAAVGGMFCWRTRRKPSPER